MQRAVGSGRRCGGLAPFSRRAPRGLAGHEQVPRGAPAHTSACWGRLGQQRARHGADRDGGEREWQPRGLPLGGGDAGAHVRRDRRQGDSAPLHSVELHDLDSAGSHGDRREAVHEGLGGPRARGGGSGRLGRVLGIDALGGGRVLGYGRGRHVAHIIGRRSPRWPRQRAGASRKVVFSDILHRPSACEPPRCSSQRPRAQPGSPADFSGTRRLRAECMHPRDGARSAR
mmetsp:Transcript_124561/g.360204  ORF Transcript_124561/g.360204 Transcript_124561/m.360204 type:complete len:229 (-) Transcript_124561:61-747(-)